MFRARDFVMWAAITWQTIVQVGKRAVLVPRSLASFYSYIAVFELDTSAVLHPACYSDYPFTWQAFELVGTLSVCAASVCLAFVKTGNHRIQSIAAVFRRMLMSLLVLLYPLVTNTTLALINCKSVVGLGGLRWASNTNFQCYANDHAFVGILSWLVLFVYVLGFPLTTFGILYRQRHQFDAMPRHWQSTWMNFTAGDYKPDAFYFAHLNLLVLLTLSLLYVFAPLSPALTPTAVATEVMVFLVQSLVLLGVIALLLSRRPFLPRKVWKLPVKCFALFVAWTGCLTNVINCANHRASATSTSVVALGLFVLALSCALVVVFIVQFIRSLLHERRLGVTKVIVPGMQASASSSSQQVSGASGLPSNDRLVANPLLSLTSARFAAAVRSSHDK